MTMEPGLGGQPNVPGISPTPGPSSFSDTTGLIRASGPYYNDLKTTIASLSHASSHLEEQTAYLEEMEKRVKISEVRLAEAISKRKAAEWRFGQVTERTENATGMFVRSVFGQRGKWEEKLREAERGYMEALQEETIRREDRTNVLMLHKEALVARQDLQEKIERHHTLQRDLRRFYNEVFSGSNPEYPEEDALESEVRDLERQLEKTKEQLDSDNKVVALLEKASEAMICAVASVEDAVGASRIDVAKAMKNSFYISSIWPKQRGLAQCQRYVKEAKKEVDKAVEISSRVKPLNTNGIPPDAVNVILNDYRSDEELHERIKDYAVKVELANIHVKEQRLLAAQRQDATYEKFKELSNELGKKSNELLELRKEIVERVLDPEWRPPVVPSFPPPEYDVVNATMDGLSMHQGEPPDLDDAPPVPTAI
ncbi:hypothetical protein CC2G_003769 [Coprinopsis cinerea AmutBmut pab1-1]|nr:hypothetical protein CC2G_003769 [Coprinopsis cinerea AmutBmut pab1-1]